MSSCLLDGAAATEAHLVSASLFVCCILGLAELAALGESFNLVARRNIIALCNDFQGNFFITFNGL